MCHLAYKIPWLSSDTAGRERIERQGEPVFALSLYSANHCALICFRDYLDNIHILYLCPLRLHRKMFSNYLKTKPNSFLEC